jgi:hypothetical protein
MQSYETNFFEFAMYPEKNTNSLTAGYIIPEMTIRLSLDF